MTQRVYFEKSQRWAELDAPIGVGGQGSFCPVVGEPQFGVKLYVKRSLVLAYRLGELVRRAVPDPRLAWPLDRVRDGPGGEVLGVLVRRVVGVTGLAILDATVAKRKAMTFDFRTRIGIACEFVAAIAVGHRAGILFEDINESNVMIVGAGRLPARPQVVLIDIDGSVRFDCRDPLTGRILSSSCGVARPEYVPPEIHRLGRSVDLTTIPRAVEQDVFAVGVLVWQLLTGVHPYSACNASGQAHPQNLSEWIQNGWWPWAPVGALPSGWQPNPGRVRDYATFPQPVRDWFHRAFHDGTVDPNLRPSLSSLVHALDDWHRRESRWHGLWEGHATRFVRLMIVNGRIALATVIAAVRQLDGTAWARRFVIAGVLGWGAWQLLGEWSPTVPTMPTESPPQQTAGPVAPRRLPDVNLDNSTAPKLWQDLLRRANRERN